MLQKLSIKVFWFTNVLEGCGKKIAALKKYCVTMFYHLKGEKIGKTFSMEKSNQILLLP